MKKYRVMERKIFNDPDDCDHSDYIDFLEPIGKMESGHVDGVYVVPFFCSGCNHFVSEEYEYNGVIVN